MQKLDAIYFLCTVCTVFIAIKSENTNSLLIAFALLFYVFSFFICMLNFHRKASWKAAWLFLMLLGNAGCLTIIQGSFDLPTKLFVLVTCCLIGSALGFIYRSHYLQ